jgi:hypothetical protein
MSYITETPVEYRLLHPHFKHLISLYMDIANEDPSLSGVDLSNIESEVTYRFGILQARNDLFKNSVLCLYIEGGKLKTSKVNGDDFIIEEMSIDVIPSGMRSLYMVSFLENLIMELDPFVDYDICQVLCFEAPPILIVDHEMYRDDVVH